MYGHSYNDEFTTSAVLSGRSTPPMRRRVAPHFNWSNSDATEGIQRRPWLNEESYSSIIEGMNRVCRYSPEEKKQRIQRYRNKRNHRNFNKTIKYACRKTLADSRLRIRGRFARNQKEDDHEEEQEEEEDCEQNWRKQKEDGDEEEEEEECEQNWTNFLQVLDFTQINPMKLLL